MNIHYAAGTSYVGRIAFNLHSHQGMHPTAIDLTEEEYKELKEEAGVPSHAHITDVLGVPITIDGVRSEQTGPGIIIAS